MIQRMRIPHEIPCSNPHSTPRKLTWNQNIDAWERVSLSSVTCIRSYISIAFQSLKKFQTNSTKTRNTMVGKSWKTKMHFPQIIQIQGIFIEPPGFGVIFADTCSGSIRKSRFKALQIDPGTLGTPVRRAMIADTDAKMKHVSTAALHRSFKSWRPCARWSVCFFSKKQQPISMDFPGG